MEPSPSSAGAGRFDGDCRRAATWGRANPRRGKRPSSSRLAREFGAHLVVDFSKEDPVARILAETGGIGVDTAIEALGAEKSFQQSVGGDKAWRNDLQRRLSWRRRLRCDPSGCLGRRDGRQDDPNRALPGRKPPLGKTSEGSPTAAVDPTKMTTHTFSFADMDKAFEIMDRKLDGVLKPLIVF